MDFVVSSYLLFTVLLIGFLALYINKPGLFKVVYFQLSRPVKWAFAFSLGLLLFLVAGNSSFVPAFSFALMAGFLLEKQERFAFFKLSR